MLIFLDLFHRGRHRYHSTGSAVAENGVARSVTQTRLRPVFTLGGETNGEVVNGNAQRLSAQRLSSVSTLSNLAFSASKASIGAISTASNLSNLENGGYYDGSHIHLQLGPDGKVYKVKCRNITIDTALLFTTVLFLAVQFALCDYYFIVYGSERRDKYFMHEEQLLNCSLIEEVREPSPANEFIWYFIGPDLLAIGAMLLLPLGALYRRYIDQQECSDAVANLRFASVAWFVYACVFDAKIILSSKTFMKVLQFFEKCDVEDVLLGVNTYIIVLCASSIVFFVLVLAHHAHTRDARELLHSISESVTFDVLDGVHFLAILLSHGGIEFLVHHPALENAIIGLVCINFLLPTISLIKIFHEINDTATHVRRVTLALLVEELVNQVTFLMLINLPYLVIRCYLYDKLQEDLSIFLLKNVIMIVIEIRQIFIHCRRIWKFTRGVHMEPGRPARRGRAARHTVGH